MPGGPVSASFDALSRKARATAFYDAVLAAQGSDEGPPGLRTDYAPDYYGAYVRDPDGNKLHFVRRGAP